MKYFISETQNATRRAPISQILAQRVWIMMCMVAMAAITTSCNHGETYAEQKEREVTAINKYIVEDGIKVISEETFKAQNYTTHLQDNEFVLFNNTGVYMQIVREGCGEKLSSGETANVLCRFRESNLLLGGDSITLTNLYDSSVLTGHELAVEKFTITNTQGTFNGVFDATSLMYQTYSSQVVPQGWLVPFTYIHLGRPANDGDEVAKVRLIVPHDQGNLAASRSVIPFYYEITFERGR